MTTFEHPLNERIRSFLRLQQLFTRLDHHLDGTSRCDLQASIGVLLDIYDLTGRNNLKTEVLRELERHKLALRNVESVNDSPVTPDGDEESQIDSDVAIDESKETNNATPVSVITIDQIEDLRSELHSQPVRSHLQLHSNEFLNSVKHRCGIAGTGSTYDLPLYHFWLDQDFDECKNTIKEWMQPYSHLREAINLILTNIRANGQFELITAERGFYQSSLKSEKTLQLVQIKIPDHSDIYPEISAGIHRITSRFMQYSTANDKPSQYLQDISFQIAICEV